MRYNAVMLQIRLATDHDAALILSFIRALAVYEREPDAVLVTELVLREQLASAVPPFECVIAELDGAPVGFALFFHTYSTWLGKRGLWLEDLFVLPEARRHGVGTALLRHVGALATERGCGRFEWSVLEWNQPALDFYARMGAKVMQEWRICRVTVAP
jgi:GNAT superfamily N-acetyltransferase